MTIMRNPNPDEVFIVQTDVLDVVVGAILSQRETSIQQKIIRSKEEICSDQGVLSCKAGYSSICRLPHWQAIYRSDGPSTQMANGSNNSRKKLKIIEVEPRSTALSVYH